MSGADRQKPGGILERFPALHRLAQQRRQGRIPYISQPSATDCGAACLAMVLASYGRHVRLDELRKLAQVDRGGADAMALLSAADQHGLRGRGIKIDDVQDLRYLERGAILHWEFNHWVVFERFGPEGVHIVDPAGGHRLVPFPELSRAFTGVALAFEVREDFEKARSQKKRVWGYLRRILTESGLFYRIVLASFLIQIFGLVLPLITGMLVDTVMPRGDYNLLVVIGLGAGMLVAFHFLSSFLRTHLLLAIQTQVDVKLTLEFLEHLVALPYAFFQLRSPGDLIMRLNSNERIREILMNGALSGLLDGMVVLIYLVLMLITCFKLGFIVVALGLINVLVFLLARRKMRDLMSRFLHQAAQSQNYQVQLLSGIETLKASGTERRAITRWSNLYVDLLNVNLARGRLDAITQSVRSGLTLASPVIILVVGGFLVLQGELSLGMMLALNAIAMGFLSPLSNLVSTGFQFQLLGSYLDRIDDVFDTAREQDSEGLAVADRLRGEVSLERVSFRYGPSEPLVIQDVSLTVRRGTFVALVGASGSGKTTLSKLLLGLYIPTSGRVLFDGTDLTSLDLRSVRRQLGVVPQNPYVFGLSVRENIAMSDPEVNMADMIEAAKLARIHDDILVMPMGYDTLLSDDGASISGGQRQRLVLARALVRRPAILLLDEATSALDALTEKKIQENLSRLRCTRIVIAHRLSTVVDADQILVMHEGHLAEQGTHEELMAKRGIYHQLVAAQMQTDEAWREETRHRAERD